jgi:hypothetical protein
MTEPRNPIWVELVIPVLTAVCCALTAFVEKSIRDFTRRMSLARKGIESLVSRQQVLLAGLPLRR